MVDPSGALSKILAETDNSGNITTYYVYGLGLVSKITPEGKAYYYHYDGIGSTVAITDSSGSIVNKYAYDAFGSVLKSEEQITNPFKYVGRFGVMDEGNGLLYMRARYYDPEVGRFTNKDPIGLSGGLNLYAYVGNNPVKFVDPIGLNWEDAGISCASFLANFIPLIGTFVSVGLSIYGAARSISAVAKEVSSSCPKASTASKSSLSVSFSSMSAAQSMTKNTLVSILRNPGNLLGGLPVIILLGLLVCF